MTGPGIYPQILEVHALLYLFGKGSNKQQRRGGIISNFTKEEAFFISYNNQVFLEIISQWSPTSSTLKKKSSSPLEFGQEENIPGQPFERGAY